MRWVVLVAFRGDGSVDVATVEARRSSAAAALANVLWGDWIALVPSWSAHPLLREREADCAESVAVVAAARARAARGRGPQ